MWLSVASQRRRRVTETNEAIIWENQSKKKNRIILSQSSELIHIFYRQQKQNDLCLSIL